ncbi:MmgE/PrpD family protein [Paenalcaligenes niemegkensis]|nr:MmgE/PrpD family protein [Paenalcaligenes niemegkensis]
MATTDRDGVHIIGEKGTYAVQGAAFANAVSAHGLVREDMHPGSICHLGVVVWPMVLALVERHRLTGRQALAAAIVGYEVGARIGRALMSSDLARLFRPTGLIGPYAAAVTGARIISLSPDQAVAAFALAGNCSAGLNEWPYTGGSEMYFHPGFVVQNSLACLQLAQLGAIASESILEGEAGLFQAYGRVSMADPIVLFANGEAEILSVFNKAVPACNFAQSPCQAALKAIGQLRGGSQQIVAVRIDSTLAAVRYPGCSSTGPFNYALQAKMSIVFGVAATLVNRDIQENNYSQLNDAEILRLVAATTLRSDGRYTAAFPEKQGARVTLFLEDGEVLSAELDDVIEADAALIHTRCLEAARSVMGQRRAQQIVALVDSFEAEPDAALLATLCSKDRNNKNRERRDQ